MEQTTLYNAINQSLAIIGGENSTVHSDRGFHLCVSQRPVVRAGRATSTRCADASTASPTRPRMVFTSYAGMIGSLPVLAQPLPSINCVVPGALIAQCNGVFNDLSPIRLASVTDGLSNTIFMAEKATTILQELNALNPKYAAQHGWYITGNWGDTLVTALYPPNACDKVAPAAMTAWTNSASSMHPGGLNVLMGDGSVRFIKDSIQSWPFDPITGNPAGSSQNAQGAWINLPPPGVWQALSTRNGARSSAATCIEEGEAVRRRRGSERTGIALAHGSLPEDRHCACPPNDRPRFHYDIILARRFCRPGCDDPGRLPVLPEIYWFRVCWNNNSLAGFSVPVGRSVWSWRASGSDPRVVWTLTGGGRRVAQPI